MTPQTGCLVWWSTNTRSAAVIAHLAATNEVPLYLVLDPAVPPPGREIRDRSVFMKRPRLAVNFQDLVAIGNSACEELSVSRVLLCPTSEYLQQALFSRPLQPLKIDALPSGKLAYLDISSKHWLVTEGPRYGLRVPEKLQPSDSNRCLPFVAKPVVNVVGTTTLRPFLVDSEATWRRFRNSSNAYFAEEYLPGTSHYWCAYRSSDGTTETYFQQNILQQPNGGSITFARILTPKKIDAATAKAGDALESFVREIDYRGPIMAEIRRGVVTELNPRFWGPLQLDATSGGRLLKAFFRDVFDVEVAVPFPATPYYVVPSHLTGSVRSIEAIRSAQRASVTARLLRGLARVRSLTTSPLPTTLGGDY